MGKFTIKQVEPIEYDFHGFYDEDDKEITESGIVPEPRRTQVNSFLNAVQAAFKEMKLLSEKDAEEDTTTPEKIIEVMAEITDDKTMLKMMDKLEESMATLCSSSPDQDTLHRLGYRPFMAFFGYLMDEVNNPKDSQSATNVSVLPNRKERRNSPGSR